MALTLEQVKRCSASKLSDPGLLPVVRLAAEVLIERAYARGICIDIYEGYRSIAYQDSLYAKGRTTPGPKVTDARGGSSYHNFGLAIDFALLSADGKRIEWDIVRDLDKDGKRDWMEVVEEAQKLGFEWGITLSGGTLDHPHLQMTFGLKTAQLRAGARPMQHEIDAACARINVLRIDSREEDDTLQLTDAEWSRTIAALQRLESQGLIDKIWVEKAQKRELTLSQLTALNTIILARK